MKQSQSKQLFENRKSLFNENQAAPFIIKRAKGPFLYDYDGNKYLDFHLNNGSLILGHAHPLLTKWIKNIVSKGYISNIPGNLDLRLSKLIHDSYPLMNGIYFFRSYNEVFHRILNEVIDNNNKILCIGSKYSPLKSESIDIFEHFEIEQIKSVLKADPAIKAICIESLSVDPFLTMPSAFFWADLMSILDEFKLELILDNEYSAFRIEESLPFEHKTPDYIILGSVIGGGFPLYGLLSKNKLAHHSDLYEPLNYIAGIETIKYLYREKPFETMQKMIHLLQSNIKNPEISIHSIASIFSINGIPEEAFTSYYQKGIYLRNSFKSGQFLSCSHTEKELLKLVKILNNKNI